ncbi:hypothetical protein G3N55_01460 [Dissulfurirhabdus thermomarina]|uniref:YncE family protein n=1 Tax=Dissulfurirhabdus thermomarina TaxID=1765737 RepID=A0A6N9TJT3_DISTH|nr:hypothetical protein [Dissulfurirhabdus thermomarina]NDY41521.1 hypothetical protein [Dissulfurirhabdus thermomarina]NMX22960.1 hypothetical protein [Dissulfurirhabdus thermomarina]
MREKGLHSALGGCLRGFAAVGLALVLAACSLVEEAGPRPGASTPGGPDGGGRLSVYFQLAAPAAARVRFELSGLEIRSGAEWLPLSGETVTVDTEILGGGQVLLASRLLPPGPFEGFRFRVAGAVLVRPGGAVPLRVPEPEVRVPLHVRVSAGDSRCVFLSLDTDRSVQGQAAFVPAVSAVRQEIPLIEDLAYVACPGIDTVAVVRTDTNRVAATLGVAGAPSYLAVDRDRSRLYVLAGAETAIKVFDLTSGRLVDVIRVPIARSPAFMAVNADRTAAVLLDEEGHYVLRLALPDGTLEARSRVGFRPRYAAFLEEAGHLAVSSGMSQEVVLLDPETLSTRQEISAGGIPEGLAEVGGRLFVAETTADTLAVVDLSQGRVERRVNVGRTPRRLLAAGAHLFLANHLSGTVSVLLPGQATVTQEIRVGGRPLEMGASERQRRLYVGDQGGRALVVVGLTSLRVDRRIPLPGVPVGIAVLR